MATNEELQLQVIYHNEQAELARAQRIAFEKGEVYSLSGMHAADRDVWMKDTIVLLTKLEADHLALRDSFLSQIQDSLSPKLTKAPLSFLMSWVGQRGFRLAPMLPPVPGVVLRTRNQSRSKLARPESDDAIG
jgi:hypothetical protein